MPVGADRFVSADGRLQVALHARANGIVDRVSVTTGPASSSSY